MSETEENRVAITSRAPARSLWGFTVGNVASMVIILGTIVSGGYKVIGDIDEFKSSLKGQIADSSKASNEKIEKAAQASIDRIDQLAKTSNDKIERAVQENIDHEARLQTLERGAIAEKAERDAFERSVSDNLSSMNRSIGILIGKNPRGQ
jgi:hypothetical protein